MSDIRYALRVLLKSPGFTLVVVLVLGLGIGATTAIFSVVDQALLRPLPFPDADRLYALMETNKDKRSMASNPESYSSFVQQNHVFEPLGGMSGRSVTLSGVPEPQQLSAQLFSPNMFQVLGVPPILGRTFLPEEDRPGAEPVAVLGEKPWRELFGSDPNIVGKLITLDGRGYRVVGVMPGSFHGPRLAENYLLWLPLSQRGENSRSSYINLYGRLRPGVSESEALAQMEVIAGRLGHGIHLTTLQEHLIGNRRPELLLMLGAVALVLLIGCANVANLLLARAAGRAREMVVRAAIGASRFRLIRQSLTESLLLAIAGGIAGLLLAVWVLHPLLAANLNLSLLQSVVLDWRVLVFAVAVSLLTSLLCGLLPALEAARVDLHRGLREGSGQDRPHKRENSGGGAEA